MLTAPLTWQQEWLWGLLQEHRDWNTVVAHAFRLKGRLNIEFLRASVEELTRRHGALRARIISDHDGSAQKIDEPRAYQLSRHVLSGGSMSDIISNAERFVHDTCNLRIDPTVGPPLSVALLKVDGSEHWLVLAIHRIIADCSSIELMLQELWILYRAFQRGERSPLAVLPPQYADYAFWQRDRRDEWLRRHQAYWSKRLSEARSVQWPLAECIEGSTRGALGKMRCLFGTRLSAALGDLARRERTLLATVMLAVYVAVLYRWCGQKDFVVPFNFAGRQSEHKSIVGCFSHVLYLRIELTGQETFRELLRRVSNEFFRALSHQDFGRMAMEKPELLSGTFFQWVTWHLDKPLDSSPLASAGSHEFTVERVPIREFGEGLTALPPGLVDVEVTLFDSKEGVYAAGVYRADKFSANRMDKFLEDMRAASEQFVHDPVTPVT